MKRYEAVTEYNKRILRDELTSLFQRKKKLLEKRSEYNDVLVRVESCLRQLPSKEAMLTGELGEIENAVHSIEILIKQKALDVPEPQDATFQLTEIGLDLAIDEWRAECRAKEATAAKAESERLALLEEQRKQAEDHVSKASTYLGQENFTEALKSIDEALKLDSGNAEYWDLRQVIQSRVEGEAKHLAFVQLMEQGNAAYTRNDFDSAIRYYTEAIRLNPNNPECAIAYSKRGEAYSDNSDYDRAIEDCTKAIQIDQKLARAYYIRGAAYSHKDNPSQTIRDCTEAINLDKELAGAYDYRGEAYLDISNYDQAIVDCAEAIRLVPKLASGAYNNRGVAYFMKGNYEQARKDFIEALRLDPKLDNAHQSLDRVCENLAPNNLQILRSAGSQREETLLGFAR